MGQAGLFHLSRIQVGQSRIAMFLCPFFPGSRARLPHALQLSFIPQCIHTLPEVVVAIVEGPLGRSDSGNDVSKAICDGNRQCEEVSDHAREHDKREEHLGCGVFFRASEVGVLEVEEQGKCLFCDVDVLNRE